LDDNHAPEFKATWRLLAWTMQERPLRRSADLQLVQSERLKRAMRALAIRGGHSRTVGDVTAGLMRSA
jgi:hypothetical protein